MPRSDKKDTTCVCYGYKFTRPAKLRQHYQSTKNQCSPSPEISDRKKGQKKVNVPRPRSLSPAPAPVVHTKEKDRRKEKVTPTPVPEPEPKKETPPPKPELTFTKDQVDDKNARKPREHLRTWSARLRRKWIKVTGEECDLSKTLKDC
jgi:hypothetical protein